MFHVMSTRVAEVRLGADNYYSSVLVVQWGLAPWLGIVQVAAVLTVWIHACIGIHFWLRTKAGIPTDAYSSVRLHSCCRRWRSRATSPPATRFCAKPGKRTAMRAVSWKNRA